MDKESLCSVVDCGNIVLRRGLCSKHFQRFRKHGTTDSVHRSGRGEPMAWLKKHSSYSGDGCLHWPFGTNAFGYGQIGGCFSILAHRVMCAEAHGMPDDMALQAAHSCGNRICVNPNHLRWDNQSGNEMDKVAHGTHNRGEQHPLSKLTADQVREIRALKGVKDIAEIAVTFGITNSGVKAILNGQTWTWLE